MNVTIDRTMASRRLSAPPARLSLTPAPGGLDGVWWPRSRALSRELPLLTAALDGPWGRLTGVTVNPAHWPVIPSWVSLAGRAVWVDWSAEEQDPHRLTLFFADGRRDVLVVPPEAGAAAAELMRGAGRGAGGRAGVAADRMDGRSAVEAWETDGGAGAPSP
ncbi:MULTISPECIES: DUF5994 family protein [Streptomyces]|uniref:SsgA family sporulation/cell division regulator n=1 Tax=Streptomyces tendae TaxID=1932 RepID=A0ABX5ZS72_STRTE|nr:DUF5994 family protein [Streptomyces tendae]QER87144.1 hypothetical protein F3L20_15675 [Streptomyces tendae]